MIKKSADTQNNIAPKSGLLSAKADGGPFIIVLLQMAYQFWKTINKPFEKRGFSQRASWQTGSYRAATISEIATRAASPLIVILSLP